MTIHERLEKMTNIAVLQYSMSLMVKDKDRMTNDEYENNLYERIACLEDLHRRREEKHKKELGILLEKMYTCKRQ